METRGKWLQWFALVAIASAFAVPLRAESSWLESVGNDYKRYYGASNLKGLVFGLGVGASLAESNVDRSVRRAYRENFLGEASNDFSSQAKMLGENQIVLLYAALIPLSGIKSTPSNSLARWGSMNVRSLLVGWPPMILSQAALGGERPKNGDSGLTPFKKSHAVSGHAFLGAIPFLTVAQMSDSPAVKTAAYVGSTATGLSRINDDMHYASQVFLGWWFAHSAVNAVSGSKTSAAEWFTIDIDPSSKDTLLVYTKQF